MNLLGVVLANLVADDRGSALTKTDERADEEELHVQEDSGNSNTVGTEVLHGLDVVDSGHKAGSSAVDEVGKADLAALGDILCGASRRIVMQGTALGEDDDCRSDGGKGGAGTKAKSCTRGAQTKRTLVDNVHAQRDQTTKDGDHHAMRGLTSREQPHLETELDGIKRHEEAVHVPIGGADGSEVCVSAHEVPHLVASKADSKTPNGGDDSRDEKHTGEGLVCLGRLLLAQKLAQEGGGTAREQEGDGLYHCLGRIDDINGRKRRRTVEVGGDCGVENLIDTGPKLQQDRGGSKEEQSDERVVTRELVGVGLFHPTRLPSRTWSYRQ